MATTDRALNLLPDDLRPLAVVPAGSDLYNTQRDFHDHDLVIIVESGPNKQLFDGDMDARILPLDQLLFLAGKGSLVECETLFALTYGHGRILDTRWAPLLQAARAPFNRYASMTDRHRSKPAFRIKDGARWDLFLRRAWETGNMDPRFTPTEREQFLDRLAKLEALKSE